MGAPPAHRPVEIVPCPRAFAELVIAHGKEVKIEGQINILLFGQVGVQRFRRLAIASGAIIRDTQRVDEHDIPRRQLHGVFGQSNRGVHIAKRFRRGYINPRQTVAGMRVVELGATRSAIMIDDSARPLLPVQGQIVQIAFLNFHFEGTGRFAARLQRRKLRPFPVQINLFLFLTD